MKKILMMTATILVFQATPVLAEDHEGEGPKGTVFEKQDLDGDGKLSEEEFLAGSRERFKNMDQDGDGYVTLEEGRALREKMREQRKERREGMPPPPPPVSGATE